MESVSTRRVAGRSFWKEMRWSAWLRHVWLLPILAIALWLRLAGISAHHLYGDEAEYSIVARYLSRDWTYLAYPQIEGFGPTPFVSQPPLLLYITALFMRVMGPTDLAALLPAVLWGVGTVAVVYFLGNRLGGRFVGLASAAVLAVLPFHIQMSRRAMLDSGYVFFVMLTLYFVVRWIQERNRAAAVGVGVSGACAALSKLPGVLVLPVAFIFLVAVLGVVLARRLRGKATTKDVNETLIQGGLGLAPVAVGGILYFALLSHLSAISNLWVKMMWQMGRVNTSNAQFTEVTAVSRDAMWYFTDPKFSFVTLIGSTIFVLGLIGLGVAIARFARHPVLKMEYAVIPVAFALMLAFFLYSDRKEGFYLLPFAPMLALGLGLTGVALRDMLAWANIKLTRQSAPRLAPIALGLAILVVAVPAYAAASSSYHYYALGQSNEKYLGEGTKEAADYIHAHDPGSIQYGSLLGRFTLYWYNEQPSYHWYVDHSFIDGQVKSGNMKYVVMDNYLGLTFDDEYMQSLVNNNHGELVAEYTHGWGHVRVFLLHP